MKVKKTNAARQLDKMGFTYELKYFEPDENNLSAEAAALSLNMPFEKVYKTLVAIGDKNGVLEACLPAGKELDLKALATASGNKTVTLVPVKDLFKLTAYQRGGCSPLGGKKDYPVYIFDEITNHEKIIINAGERGLMFLISPEVLIKACNATLAKITKI